MDLSNNQRGNTVLTYLGFEYNKFRENNITNVVTWRCRQYKSSRCKAFIKTNEGNIVGAPSTHSHDSCPQKANANIAMRKMKERIKHVGATPRNVIGNELIGLTNDVLAHLPKQSSITRNLLRHKKGDHLPNPNTPDFQIPEKYANLILHDSGIEDPDRILAIGDLDLMQTLDGNTIYGDGTFDKVPKMFFQLYTLHAKVGNSYPPCIYFLLQRKNLSTYSKMFEILKYLLPNLAPQKMLIDFEKACISAVNIAFPNAEVKGCYFHLCQSLIRKVNSVGLKVEFESDIEVKLKLKSLAALAFVPSNEVRAVFNVLADSFPDEDKFNEILTYFFSTYIEGAAGRDPQFPIRVWNHHEAAAERSPKTTNCCEGFHNALNSIFHCSHPSVWVLLDGLQRDLACHKLTLEKARVGQPEVKKKKYEALHEQVAHVVQGYFEEQDKLRFLRHMANLQ